MRNLQQFNSNYVSKLDGIMVGAVGKDLTDPSSKPSLCYGLDSNHRGRLFRNKLILSTVAEASKVSAT